MIKKIHVIADNVQKGDVFCSIPGDLALKNIEIARKNGAILIFAQKDMPCQDCGDIIYVDDVRMVLSKLSRNAFKNQPDCCVAITGTNGKSSTCHFTRQIWESAGDSAANLGSLGLFISDSMILDIEVPSLTTPDPVSLHMILEYLSQRSVTHLAFEASSHALEQKRLHSVDLKAAAFLNFASDHLDYHKTKESYFASKMRLFNEILPADGFSIFSMDFDEISQKMPKNNAVTFGFSEKNMMRAENIVEKHNMTVFDLIVDTILYKGVELNLFGRFQVMNVLAASAIAHATNVNSDIVAKCISEIKPLNGRMEYVCNHNGGYVYIDYAHTSEGFRNCLETVSKVAKNRVICVFGCGGGRDPSKRAEMGRIAGDLADISIITDDNPRMEDPASIRRSIIEFCDNGIEIASRDCAIKYAMEIISEGDFLVVIGKGHERTQVYSDCVIEHNDRDVIMKYSL